MIFLTSSGSRLTSSTAPNGTSRIAAASIGATSRQLASGTDDAVNWTVAKRLRPAVVATASTGPQRMANTGGITRPAPEPV